MQTVAVSAAPSPCARRSAVFRLPGQNPITPRCCTHNLLLCVQNDDHPTKLSPITLNTAIATATTIIRIISAGIAASATVTKIPTIDQKGISTSRTLTAIRFFVPSRAAAAASYCCPYNTAAHSSNRRCDAATYANNSPIEASGPGGRPGCSGKFGQSCP